MEDEKRLLYAIWLNQSCANNPKTIAKVLAKYHTPKEAFLANPYEGELNKILGLGRVLKLDRTLESAKRLLKYCKEHEIHVFDQEDERYPELLRHVSMAPNLLYAKGNLPDLNRILGVTIVGTRNATDDGETMAQQLGRSLAENGITIISGMARGIDGAAHCGALEAGGTTLAVLAGGVDVIYPTEHSDLYRHILTHGGVLSEQPPGVKGKPQFYQDRNRIMVGLSRGTIITEGECKSGTSITARLATENNRDIFAVPGNPIHSASELPNSLIRDGAKQVTGPLDVLEEYIELYPQNLEYGLSVRGVPVTGRVEDLNHPPKTPTELRKEPPVPTAEEQKYQLELMFQRGSYKAEEVKILQYLSEHIGMVSFDELVEGCEMNAGKLSSMLIILQMKKVISQSAGGQYCIQFTMTE